MWQKVKHSQESPQLLFELWRTQMADCLLSLRTVTLFLELRYFPDKSPLVEKSGPCVGTPYDSIFLEN